MIIAFTKDWNDVPTCTTHILREFGQKRPILWVNSIGTRRPDVRKVTDLRRIFSRLTQFVQGPKNVETNISVISPLLFPAARNKIVLSLNRYLFRTQIAGWLSHNAIKKSDLEYWCFVPNAVSLVPEDSFIVYYCVDDWSSFHNLDGEWLASQERLLMERADVIFAVSEFLVKKLEEILKSIPNAKAKNINYSPHGVNYAMFKSALEKENKMVPADIKVVKHPLIGFYGNLQPWIDFDLLEKMIAARPNWSFVFIGEKFCDVSRIERFPNVKMVGRKDYRELTDYCRFFDAAIIPYDMKQKRMQSVNPVKTLELLAAGVPVVASNIPELRKWGASVQICRTFDEWMAALDRAVARKDREEISRSVESFDWKTRVAEIEKIIMMAKENKLRRRNHRLT